MVLLHKLKTFGYWKQGMKPQGSFTGTSLGLMGRTQPTPADRMLQRVRVVTHELEAIQNEMCRQLADSDGTPRKNASPDAAAAADLRLFKTVVDQMRRILWFYTGTGIAELHADAGSRQPTTLRDQKPSDQADDSEVESGSFFERLNVVIDGYIQTGAAATSRRSKL
jgi:hypothetical protein